MARKETATLHITGMSGANCAAHVEKALKAVPGVAQANVNIATERATVDFDPQMTGCDGLIAAVVKAGYGVLEEGREKPDQVELNITGRTCANCPTHVAKVHNAAPGVVDANVNLATKRAFIQTDGSVGEHDMIAL